MSAPRPLGVGDVVTARFPPQTPGGHEQEGHRPAIVIGVPDLAGPPRFPLYLVVPMTSDHGQAWATAAPALYPRFPAGVARLRSPSIALLDQARAIDLARIERRRGTLTPDELEPVRAGLRAMLGL